MTAITDRDVIRAMELHGGAFASHLAIAATFNLQAENDEPANEPDGLIDSWPFLICFGIAVALLVWGVAQGYV